MSTKTCCTGQGPCPVCGGTAKRYVRSQFDDDYDPKLPDGYTPMTTPDPITTAREALDKAYEVCRNLGGTDDADFHAISAALDYATGLSVAHEECLTEIKRLEIDNEKLKSETDPQALVIAHMHGAQMATEKHREEIASLKAERDEALTAHEDRGFDCERLSQDNTRLTSQLEQAERFAELISDGFEEHDYSDCADDEPMVIDATAGDMRRASQWIKDRQAKGEG